MGAERIGLEVTPWLSGFSKEPSSPASVSSSGAADGVPAIFHQVVGEENKILPLRASEKAGALEGEGEPPGVAHRWVIYGGRPRAAFTLPSPQPASGGLRSLI